MLKLHNTLGGKLEPFEPVDPARGVRLYTCGPTVYNLAHVGNFRAYMFADVLRRYLEFKGYPVTQVMNLTDVDDKTIRDSIKAGLSLRDFTDRYIGLFFEDVRTLGIKPATVYPRATEHIEDMVAMIRALEDRGHAYRSDGSIYFRIASFPGYGRLSGVKLDEMRSGLRYDSDEYEKDNVQDFVLWKAPKEGEPVWETEIGPGRPGWHIECSAMSMRYLGESFDIHTGGVDNIFPHHENEIAQSEAATGRPFVRFWLHCAHLTMGEEKMAKRLGNVKTVRDLVAEGHDPMAIRYFLLAGHYRKPLVFTYENLAQAGAALARLREFAARMRAARGAGSDDAAAGAAADAMLAGFEAAMDDDLNVSGALGAVFETVSAANRALDEGRTGEPGARRLLSALARVSEVLGVLSFEEEAGLAEEVEALIAARQEARRRKDWAEADRIRDELKGRGIELQDTKAGLRWRR